MSVLTNTETSNILAKEVVCELLKKIEAAQARTEAEKMTVLTNTETSNILAKKVEADQADANSTYLWDDSDWELLCEEHEEWRKREWDMAYADNFRDNSN
jgi:hypothetical protein